MKKRLSLLHDEFFKPASILLLFLFYKLNQDEKISSFFTVIVRVILDTFLFIKSLIIALIYMINNFINNV